MTADILHQNDSFFTTDDWRPYESLLPVQTDPSAPHITGTDQATGMLVPDRHISSRLAHFPSDLYDLREESHLVRFLKALLGESGTGQLRKRNTVAQFQTAWAGTHFYDLDRFYGAIFGVTRLSTEILPINPMEGVAEEEEWDDIQARDASYKARVQRLAAAINLGATVPGLKQACEALTQVECDVYETWALLDTYGIPGTTGRLWSNVSALPEASTPTWAYWTDQRLSWFEIEDVTTIGRTGTNTRAEVIVVPKKDYSRLANEEGSEEAARQRAEDTNSIIRVLHVLKPASVLLTVDNDGIALHNPAHITHLEADSNYWEVITKVQPRADISLGGLRPYPRSLRQQLRNILYHDKRPIPKPPWAVQQAAEWSYNPEIVGVTGYSFFPDDDYEKDEAGKGEIIDLTPSHVVTYQDGTRERFSVDRALLDPRRALAARYASEGILVSHPYSGDRKRVETHG